MLVGMGDVQNENIEMYSLMVQSCDTYANDFLLSEFRNKNHEFICFIERTNERLNDGHEMNESG